MPPCPVARAQLGLAEAPPGARASGDIDAGATPATAGTSTITARSAGRGSCCSSGTGAGRVGRRQVPDPILRFSDRRAAMHHGPGELEHWIAVPGLLLEALGEPAALDVLQD